MDPDKKKKFNFGTGEIDVDQWLLDIDAGLPDYYERMGKTYHNKENEEVRNAMTDLIGRISSGDMLSRSANGTYNFRSQLYSPNRGKYTKWAYLTALSYIGGKGRNLVTSPKQQEEEPTTTKNKYSTLTLIKRFNNSVQRGSTQLNLDNTWWGSASMDLKAKHLSEFLNKEAAYIRGTDIDDVDDVYKDLGKEGLATAMTTLASQILSNPEGDYGRQFGNIGITNLLKRPVLQTEPVKVLTPLERLQLTQKEEEQARLDTQANTQLNWRQNGYVEDKNLPYNVEVMSRYNDYTKYNEAYQRFLNSENYKRVVRDYPRNLASAWIARLLLLLPLVESKFGNYNFYNHYANLYNSYDNDTFELRPNFFDTNSLNPRQLAYLNHLTLESAEIKNLLKDFQDNWETKYFNGVSTGENTINLLRLAAALGFTSKRGGNPYNLESPLVQVRDGLFYIPGTYRKDTGNIALLDTKNKKFIASNMSRYPQALYSNLWNALADVLYQKQGGVLKLLGGNVIPSTLQDYANLAYPEQLAPAQLVTTQQLPTQGGNSRSFSRQRLTPGDITRLGSMGADILSLATSFGKGKALSKFSRWASVGAGVGNLVGDAMNYGSGSGARTPMAGAWFGHDIADLGIRLYGATPFGNRGVAIRLLSLNLSRNFLQYGRALAPFVLASLNNKEAATALMLKATSGRFSELNTDEWMILATALEGLISGKAVQVHTQRARAADKAITHYNVTGLDGNTKTVTKLEYMGRRKAFGYLPSNEDGRGVPVRTQQGLVDNNKFTIRDGYYSWMGSWVQPWAQPNRVSKSSQQWFNRNTHAQDGYTRRWDPQLNNGEGGFEPTDRSKMIIGPVRNAPQRQSLNVLRDLRQGPVDYTSRPAPAEPVRQPEPIIQPEPEIGGGSIVIGQPEPEIQIPLRPQEPPARPATLPQRRQNRGKGRKRRHELGGYFTFLRTGGVVKYQQGGLTGINSGQGYNWYNNVFSGYKLHILDGIGTLGYVDWLNTMQGNHANLHTAAGSDWKNVAYKDASVKTYQEAYLKGFEGYDTDNPYNKTGIGKAYATQGHYDFSGSNNRGTAEVNQGLFVGNPDGLYSQMTDDRRLLGREGDWTPEQLQEWNTALKAKGYVMEPDPTDHYYRINPIDNSGQNATGNDPDPNAEKVKPVQEEPADQEHENGLVVGNPLPQLKKPFDPRALFILGRGASTIFGNSWMYDRIYDRIPNPAYKDFIDRRLDTIGDYAYLAHAGNQAADLRAIQQLRLVSDQSLNLAADFESGRIGREAMDKAFLQDATKQATTHEAALQMDLKDVEDRRDVAWYNRVALNKYLSDRADVLNAKDKANLDATLGVVNNLTQLGASKYLEKKAAYDKAQATIMQQPLERAQERMRTQHAELYNKVANGTASDAEVAQYQQLLALYLREARLAYATDFYSLYGGGVKYPKKQHGEAEVIATPTNEQTSTYANPWEDPVNLDKKGGKLEFVKSLRQ